MIASNVIPPPQSIELLIEKYDLYVVADQLIHERLGCSPGPAYLMAMVLEVEGDPADLADIYCHTILQLANN